MKRLILLLSFLCSVLSFGYCQTNKDKNQIITSTNFTNIFLLSSPQVRGGYIDVWVVEIPKKGKLNEFRNQTIEDRKNNNLPIAGFDKYSKGKERLLIDCANNRFKTLAWIRYNNTGYPISDYTWSADQKDWEDATPGTIGAGFIRFFCQNQ